MDSPVGRLQQQIEILHHHFRPGREGFSVIGTIVAVLEKEIMPALQRNEAMPQLPPGSIVRPDPPPGSAEERRSRASEFGDAMRAMVEATMLCEAIGINASQLMNLARPRDIVDAARKRLLALLPPAQAQARCIFDMAADEIERLRSRESVRDDH